MEKVTAFKATDGSLHNSAEKALEASLSSFLRTKTHQLLIQNYSRDALIGGHMSFNEVCNYLSKNPQEFINFYNEHSIPAETSLSKRQERVFTKEDLENAYNRGYHDDEYVRNGNSGGFKDWYEDEYGKD